MSAVNSQQLVRGRVADATKLDLYIQEWWTNNAAGRKEVISFFYAYTLLTMCSLVIDTGVVPSASAAYPYFVAAQCGLVSATCICLMINGFVGFQLYEDGTPLSVWLIRTCSVAMFLISFAVSLLTFKGWGGLGPENTIGLFVVVYLFSALCLFVYVAMQIVLVVGTLQERWPLWHIAFGISAFVIGQVLLYALSETICENVEHYLDGLFFATLLNLLAVMMVYKVCFGLAGTFDAQLISSQYWDSITKEDLEFSVGQKQNNWEIKEQPLYEDMDKRGTGYQESDYESVAMYHPQGHRTSESIY